MPTNQEWLHKLANESPDELKAWFDAEHNDNLAAEKVVSGDAAHSNDGNAHLKASEDLSDGFTDSREKLEADVRSSLGFTTKDVFNWLDRQEAITEREYMERSGISELQGRVDELREAFDEVCKSANVPTDWKPIFSAGAVTGTIEGTQKLLKELTAERDNLADDLLACNREREQLRKHLGIALDHAHDICSLVDIDGNVLDVGD